MTERTEQQKALDLFIHDHAGAMGGIRNLISFIKKYYEIGELTKEKLHDYINRIDERVQKANGALDYYYLQFKKDFK